ncbi:hypothetical protein LB467_16295 [Salegentibacter sp. JZCK2]|uniref:hypothetical protein n=1 Tax=Salegentibacter tibetensis TaxID=2873600 RepID=UPI001CC9E3CE|nr:hypothetical protein [Salegentibacter tibetensis]MBZ9731252.1 hypothetical protein [Salegentibacter tibetensis]
MSSWEPPYTRTVRTVVWEVETGINPVSPTRFISFASYEYTNFLGFVSFYERRRSVGIRNF